MQETYIGNYISIIYESIKDNDNLFAIGVFFIVGYYWKHYFHPSRSLFVSFHDSYQTFNGEIMYSLDYRAIFPA